MNNVVIKNSQFTLTVGSDAIVKSLIHTESGQECLDFQEDVALFSVTQDRPFNNEIKLAHPNKRTTFQANSLAREGNRLIVGFEILPYKAIVEVEEKPLYVSFTLVDFIVNPKDYEILISPPPVREFRLIQLPVKNRKYFGEWLNASWDEDVAVNVLANSPYAKIDSERFKKYRIMYADALKDVKLRGCSATMIVTSGKGLMDAIGSMEEDYGLPNGAKSRRGEKINASMYWASDVTPENVDMHINYAKKGGFRMMLLYYTCFFKYDHGYDSCGDYDYNEHYPNGAADVKKVLDKIHAAGITPGMHFLQTHIGFKTRYVTPEADSRLALKERFTLAKALDEKDTTVYVEQSPEGCIMADKTRILKFGGELISYEGYTTTQPYAFTGCQRGVHATNVTCHEKGTWGGVLDVSEYGGTSTYIDQNTDLQDEVADKLAEAFNQGCRFVYFDGSEGANIPYEIYIPYAQYRVYKKLSPEPLFAEGAAKAHFSWHMMSGGNAFDIWPMPIFKEKIAEFPAEEAPRMRQDLTRLNFGWWGYYKDTQPDMYEYGTSRAAAWDCPVTMMEAPELFKTVARTDDTLEVLRRWEDVRATGWLTAEMKEQLKDLEQEHILLINEQGEYELQPYNEVKNAAGGNAEVRAYTFERCGKSYAVIWHATGKGVLELADACADLLYEEELGGEKIALKSCEGSIELPIEGRRYLSCGKSVEELNKMLENARLAD